MAEENSNLLEGDFPGRLISPLFYNMFYISVQPQFVRFTFGESVFSNSTPNYTSAIAMPTDVSLDMAQAIIRLAVGQGLVKIEDLDLGQKREAVDVG